MTSITLPLKEIPGQRPRLPTFFGGRKITMPAVFLVTVPFTLYLYLRLSRGSMLSHNIMGLLPYFWGSVSIANYVKKSSRAMEMIIEADLDEAERVFEAFRIYFRHVLLSNGFISIIIMTVCSYLLISHGRLTLFIVGWSSITSIGVIIFSSAISRYEWKWTLTYIFLAFAFEAAFLIAAFRGPWELNLIFPVAYLIMLYVLLRKIDAYDLRSFFEGVMN